MYEFMTYCNFIKKETKNKPLSSFLTVFSNPEKALRAQ